ncbi:MAG: hypothetical protein GY922_13545 [Proteobacteria bacterium]|nr:hypothetical protein [Pseudomonadota bacterium]
MSEDSVDSALLLNATVRCLDDDLDRPIAATANLNVDIEHALDSLGLGHSSMRRASHLLHIFLALAQFEAKTF